MGLGAAVGLTRPVSPHYAVFVPTRRLASGPPHASRLARSVGSAREDATLGRYPGLEGVQVAKPSIRSVYGWNSACGPLSKLRRRSELATTETLDSDIAALARTGDKDQPRNG